MVATKGKTRSRELSKRKTKREIDPCLINSLDDVLSKLRDAEGDEPLRKRGPNRCQGQRCRGVGRGSHYVPGRCPNPCDENQYTDNAHEVAKKAAQREAHFDCLRQIPASDCRCKEGKFGFLRKECIEIVIGGVQYCAYDVYYEYVGKCLP